MIDQSIEALVTQGETFNTRGDFRAALKALNAIQPAVDDGSQLATRLYVAIGFAKFRLGDLTGAIVGYQRALAFAEEHGTLEEVHVITTSLASCLAHAGETRSAVEGLEKLLTLEKGRGISKALQTETLASLGRIYDASKLDLKRAKEYYESALGLWGTSHLPLEHQDIIYQLARLHDIGGETDEARTLYHKYLQQSQESGVTSDFGVSAALRALSLGPIDLIADEIEHQFRWYITAPQAKATFLQAIGSFFRDRGMLADAALVLQKALFLSSSTKVTGELAAIAKALAAVYEDQGQPTLALEVLADAINRIEDIDQASVDGLELAQKLIRKGAKHHNDDFVERGVSALLASSAGDAPTRKRYLLEASNAAVVFLLQANRNEAAIKLITKALRHGKPYSEGIQHIIGALNFNLALAYRRVDNIRGALRSIERSAHAYEKAKRPQDVADTYSFRFRLYYSAGDYAAALAMAREEVKTRQKNGSTIDEPYAESILALGGILSTLKRDREVESVYASFVRELERSSTEVLGFPNVSVSCILNNLGYLYFQQNRYDDALAHFDRAIKLLSSVDANPTVVAAVLESKAELLAATKRLPQAVTLYRSVIELREQAGAGRELGMARAQRDLALVLRELGATEEAAVALNASLVIYRQLSDADPVEVARVLDLAARFADSGGRNTEVKTLLAEAATLREVVQQSESIPKSTRASKMHSSQRTGVASRVAFLTPDQIVAVVLKSPLSRGDRRVRNVLLLFSTLKQHTWLISTATKLFCILDDEKCRARDRLIQWVQPWDSIRSIQVKPYKAKSGLVTIGRRQNWLYSRELHPDPQALHNHITSLRHGETNFNSESEVDLRVRRA